MMLDSAAGTDAVKNVKRILVIGASGFLGKHVALARREKGHNVRCSARDLSRVQRLAAAGCETVQADISDDASLKRALNGTEAVYIRLHTLSPQTANATDQRFMDVEMAGLQNIVTSCKPQDVRRPRPSRRPRSAFAHPSCACLHSFTVTATAPALLRASDLDGTWYFSEQASRVHYHCDRDAATPICSSRS